MVTIRRTDNGDNDFIQLVEWLDRDLLARYGKAQETYQPFNSIDQIREVVIACLNDVPVGCGCFKPWEERTTELKRMYVKPGHRSLGIASKVLSELERWSAELGYERMILETGKGQPEAIRLYEKNGYTLIPNFGQYEGMKDSICMEKRLR
ncbi:MAG: GNAT family N-acetyltransferase [Chitinophagaceae bacterium]|nr:GNAT family N-acetyltransferase [Chitinophagaceae bacterium]MBL0334437.1 GNAT family N-acetyltransferase [Chitinophagaceae bacterium]